MSEEPLNPPQENQQDIQQQPQQPPTNEAVHIFSKSLPKRYQEKLLSVTSRIENWQAVDWYTVIGELEKLVVDPDSERYLIDKVKLDVVKRKREEKLEVDNKRQKRDKSEVICNKCKKKGHYANECTVKSFDKSDGKDKKMNEAKRKVDGKDKKYKRFTVADVNVLNTLKETTFKHDEDKCHDNSEGELSESEAMLEINDIGTSVEQGSPLDDSSDTE